MTLIEDNRDYVWLASVALYKKLTKDEFSNSAFMQGNIQHLDKIWDIVAQAKVRGLDWFYVRYRDYKLYGSSTLKHKNNI